jgi:NAD(P)-dependent dehydrogenase (short-subunit alcohol dehydrogenase family)
MEGQIAIVTGGAGNVGRGVCWALTKAGATVVALDIDVSKAEGVERAVECDVADADACRAAVDQIISDFGAVSTLVNMAQKIIIETPIMELTADHLRASYETGPIATLRMMQLCYPGMKMNGGGAIVNFASDAGTRGIPGMGAYGSAKEAIRGITKTAALEWGRDNINVNALCPVAFSNKTSDWAQRSAASVPMARVGDPETDIGSVVVFLAGPGRFINGRTLHVDGGKGAFR